MRGFCGQMTWLKSIAKNMPHLPTLFLTGPLLSELVGLPYQVHCQVEDDFEGFVLVQTVFGYEAAEEGAVDPAGDVVAGGDGEEGTGVVVEAYGVVEAGGLGGLFAEAHHAFRRVVEPPGRTQFERGIVAGERGELTGEGGLVEGEEDEGEAGVVAVLVEQRAQGADVFGRRGHVGAFVAAELFIDLAVVIADRSGVE